MRPVSSRFLQSSSSFERASSSPRTRAKERKGENEKENEGKRERKVFSHERVRSSRPLALRFFHPFFLSPPFSLSFIKRLLGPLRSSCNCLFFFRFSISSSYVLRSVIARESLLGSLIFLLPPGEGASSSSVVLVFRVVLFLFFRLLILLRVALFPSEFTPEKEYFSSSAGRLHLPCPLLPFPRPFLSLSIAVFCTLRI